VRRHPGAPFLLAASLLGLLAPWASGTAASFERTEHREPCAAYNELRSPFFGDLHVHTSLSFDANALGVRNLPADAYRFARGEPLGLQPYAAGGQPRRTVRLSRPLDFAAVTDHAELLGELHLCQTPGSPAYDSLVCTTYRRWPLLTYFFVASRMLSIAGPERYSFCGEEGVGCREAGVGPWQIIRDAAEQAYDRTSACTFTSFVAYEWSGGPGGYMTHRNVIFADERAPRLPVSFLDASDGDKLWTRLEEECEREGCRFVTIPHNTNLSGGLLFESAANDAFDAASARRRARHEPLLEVLQHKGDSECRATAADELCNFEKLPFARMEEQPFPFRWQPPGALTFARDILSEGLRIQRRIGVNPYEMGVIAATDTHLAAAGLADESGYPGHGAGGDVTRHEIPLVPDSLAFNPGGLAVLWAEENSRDALFAAIRRREAYGTSGPRMLVRFFGGWTYPSDICASTDLVERGYRDGVPMGGSLGAATGGAAPVFIVSAMQDAGTGEQPGTPLERVQIVKLWVEGDEAREKTYDVALAAGAEGAPDPETCAEPAAHGAASLCTAWRDPDFDGSEPALYYARVVERPSCRWSARVCEDNGVRCKDGSSVPRELAYCCDGSAPRLIRERAWTSPIFFSPAS